MKKISLSLFAIAILVLVGFNIHSLTRTEKDSPSSENPENTQVADITQILAASSTATSTATSSEIADIDPSTLPQKTIQVLAYGKNDHGQLGGKISDAVIHKNISITSGYQLSKLYAGKGHTLALTSTGEVVSWGNNDYGQLGYKTKNANSPIPKQIPGLKNIIALATTNNHSLALDKDGTVWAWGQNFTGQIGNGNRTNTFTPYKVEGIPEIAKISAGHKYSLALAKNGEVWAWGASCDANGIQKAKNILSTIGSNLSSLEGGYYDNKSNGDSSYDPYQDCLNEDQIKIKSLTPIKLPAQNIAQISTGYGHSLLLTKTGTVIAFGCNFYEQVGYEAGTRKGEWLKNVEGLSNITTVAAGARHSVALDKDGNVYAFGANFAGQLADGGTEKRSQPKKIEGLPPIRSIYASFDYTIAIAKDGSVWAWGGNSSDLLIPDVADRIDLPIEITNVAPKNIATGGMHLFFQY